MGVPNPITVFDFVNKSKRVFSCEEINANNSLPGHRYADQCAIDSFIKAVANQDKSYVCTGK